MEKVYKIFQVFIIPQAFHIQSRLLYLSGGKERKKANNRDYSNIASYDSFGHRLCIEARVDVSLLLRL